MNPHSFCSSLRMGRGTSRPPAGPYKPTESLGLAGLETHSASKQAHFAVIIWYSLQMRLSRSKWPLPENKWFPTLLKQLQRVCIGGNSVVPALSPLSFLLGAELGEHGARLRGLVVTQAWVQDHLPLSVGFPPPVSYQSPCKAGGGGSCGSHTVLCAPVGPS